MTPLTANRTLGLFNHGPGRVEALLSHWDRCSPLSRSECVAQVQTDLMAEWVDNVRFFNSEVEQYSTKFNPEEPTHFEQYYRYQEILVEMIEDCETKIRWIQHK